LTLAEVDESVFQSHEPETPIFDPERAERDWAPGPGMAKFHA
jgi:hypothetical protein